MQKRIHQVDRNAGGHDGCQYEVERHASPPSNAITIDRVPDRQGEEAEPQSYQRGIQHCLLLADECAPHRQAPFPRFGGAHLRIAALKSELPNGAEILKCHKYQ
jgi:hypothetical protein